MTEDENHVSIEEYKIKASILLKALRSNDASTSTQAAKRFGCLVEFENRPWSEIKTSAKRKHALAVVAIEHGYDSWTALKNSLESDLSETFVPHYKGGFLNKWFATYETAKIEQQASGGFLLPYKKQFFVCEASYIDALGMDPNDPDWNEIGRDWVRPLSKKAFQRLNKKWLAIKTKNLPKKT